MRSENISTEVVSLEDSFWIDSVCDLCKMENSTEENARIEWYDNFVETTEKFTPKQPTEEELREEATKLRSQRKGND